MMLGLLLLAAIAACGSKPASPIELTGTSNAPQQALAVGQQLKITLDSNPSTGYRWAVDGAVPPQLQQVAEASYDGTANMPGAGGTEVWTFVGKSAGTGALKLKYWRSFEPTATPVRTFKVSVDVR